MRRRDGLHPVIFGRPVRKDSPAHVSLYLPVPNSEGLAIRLHFPLSLKRGALQLQLSLYGFNWSVSGWRLLLGLKATTRRDGLTRRILWQRFSISVHVAVQRSDRPVCTCVCSSITGGTSACGRRVKSVVVSLPVSTDYFHSLVSSTNFDLRSPLYHLGLRLGSLECRGLGLTGHRQNMDSARG